MQCSTISAADSTDTRWPEAEVVDDWSQGVPLAWMQDMCRYWRDGYDWRAAGSAR